MYYPNTLQTERPNLATGNRLQPERHSRSKKRDSVFRVERGYVVLTRLIPIPQQLAFLSAKLFLWAMPKKKRKRDALDFFHCLVFG